MVKRLFTKYWFTWANILLGIICAVTFQVVKTPNDGNAVEFLIAFITMSISLLSWWLEFREMELLTESQLLNYLDAEIIYPGTTVIGKNKVAEIYRIKAELREKSYDLSYPQMEEYTSDAVKECLAGKNGIKRYYAIHHVNSPYFRKVWEFRNTAEAKRDEFIEAQRDFLNNGGQIIRIFIFDPAYFESCRPQCLKVLTDHEKYYENTDNKIITLACMSDPLREAHLTYDFTLIGTRISFQWRRKIDNKGYGNGTCYVSKGKDSQKFSSDFERIKRRAKPKDIFIETHSR